MAQDYSLGTVDVALTPRQHLEEYLQSKGKRLTEQRRMLVDQIFDHHEHFDADELIDRLARQGGPKRVSRPTVYRTLLELTEAGLLKKIMEVNGRTVYDHDYGYPAHDHLHCEKCGSLIEFHSDEVARIRDAVAQEYGFRVSSHRLIIEGVCKDCQMVTRKRPRRLDRI